MPELTITCAACEALRVELDAIFDAIEFMGDNYKTGAVYIPLDQQLYEDSVAQVGRHVWAAGEMLNPSGDAIFERLLEPDFDPATRNRIVGRLRRAGVYAAPSSWAAVSN